MPHNPVQAIQEKLLSLFDSINQISPLNDFTSSDYHCNNPYINDLLKVLDVLINKANLERENMLKEIQRLESDMIVYSKQLNIHINEIPVFENLGLHKEFLENELNKIFVVRKQIEAEIKIILENIRDLERELGIEIRTFDTQNCISLNILEKLKIEKNNLEIKIKDLEVHRQSYYDKITELSDKLGRKVEFSYSEKICDLKKQMVQIRDEFQERKTEFDRLLEEIKRRESLLNFEHKKIDYNFNDGTLTEVKEYNSFLQREQNRLFDEIYDRILEQIKEIDIILGREGKEYEKSEESLVEMRKFLDKHQNIKNEHFEIIDCIDKRKTLLMKMTEFEILASDPKRLFKSSFQLISEEKFRNSAYPSLLKIEETLFDKIDSYEENYGIFIYEGRPFRLALKNEIDNRIINRTVFISRCDSPYRKKK